MTQLGHGICSANGEPCDCETDAHTVAVTEEHSRDSGTDSARFLAAGAVRSYWVRTRQGQLAEAMPRVRKELAQAKNAILESNSIVRFLKPDLYLTVLDPATRDFKPSAQYFLDRADAVLWSGTQLHRKSLHGRRNGCRCYESRAAVFCERAKLYKRRVDRICAGADSSSLSF